MAQIKVLFVCLGNICRSPTAEGVFRELVARAGLSDQIKTDSAGTSGWHIGAKPDPRSLSAGKKRGYDFADLRARQATKQDFIDFDYVLAMDKANFRDLRALCPHGYEERLQMFLSFDSDAPVTEVPDPYYGGPNGFDQVVTLIEGAAEGLLRHIKDHNLHDRKG